MAHLGEQRARPADTTPAAWARYLECLRETPALTRLRRAFELSSQVRTATFAAIRRAHLELDERGLRLEFLRRVYGVELASKVAAAWAR